MPRRLARCPFAALDTIPLGKTRPTVAKDSAGRRGLPDPKRRLVPLRGSRKMGIAAGVVKRL